MSTPHAVQGGVHPGRAVGVRQAPGDPAQGGPGGRARKLGSLTPPGTPPNRTRSVGLVGDPGYHPPSGPTCPPTPRSPPESPLLLAPVGLWFQGHTGVGGPSVPLRDVRCPAPCEGLSPRLLRCHPQITRACRRSALILACTAGPSPRRRSVTRASVVSRGGLGGGRGWRAANAHVRSQRVSSAQPCDQQRSPRYPSDPQNTSVLSLHIRALRPTAPRFPSPPPGTTVLSASTGSTFLGSACK